MVRGTRGSHVGAAIVVLAFAYTVYLAVHLPDGPVIAASFFMFWPLFMVLAMVAACFGAIMGFMGVTIALMIPGAIEAAIRKVEFQRSVLAWSPFWVTRSIINAVGGSPKTADAVAAAGAASSSYGSSGSTSYSSSSSSSSSSGSSGSSGGGWAGGGGGFGGGGASSSW